MAGKMKRSVMIDASYIQTFISTQILDFVTRVKLT